MDNLPDHLIITILSRLNDSTELARCKCVSKTLNRLARQVPSIHLYCSLDRYRKMRSPEARWKVTPFKSIIHKLISDAEAPIESVSLGIEESFYSLYDHSYYVENRRDDLFLTAGLFCEGWMTKICHGLKSISISAFSPQSHFKETDILEVISYHCDSLVELKLENVYLCADDMRVMPLLTRLMLNNATILDKILNKLMDCLPCLHVLNILNARGVREPKIHHLNLKELKWTQDNWEQPDVPDSLTIYAPNLTKLELEFLDPIALSIHAPLLSYFHLDLECEDQCTEFDADNYNLGGFNSLQTLSLKSPELYYLLVIFPSSRAVVNLTLDSPNLPKWCSRFEGIKFSLVDVFNVFPNVTGLTLGFEVWSQQLLYPLAPLPQTKSLKQITLYLVLGDIDKALSFILYIVGICKHLSDILLFINRDVDLIAAITFVSRCTSQCPKVRLRWGIWKEGTKDC